MKRTQQWLSAAAIAAAVGCVGTCAYLFLCICGQHGGFDSPTATGTKADFTHPPTSSAAKVPVAAPKRSEPPEIRELVLVNPRNRLPDWYHSNLVKAFGMEMDSEIVGPFTKMKDAAAKDGVSLWISSAYRSSARQEVLLQQEIRQYSKGCSDSQAALADAERSVAKPGYSEHETGLALDLNGVKDDFDRTPASRWLRAHAQEYGFILRYPKDKQSVTGIKYEPWHYRYVGEGYAILMKKNNLCLEEYLRALEKAKAVD